LEIHVAIWFFVVATASVVIHFVRVSSPSIYGISNYICSIRDHSNKSELTMYTCRCSNEYLMPACYLCDMVYIIAVKDWTLNQSTFFSICDSYFRYWVPHKINGKYYILICIKIVQNDE